MTLFGMTFHRDLTRAACIVSRECVACLISGAVAGRRLSVPPETRRVAGLPTDARQPAQCVLEAGPKPKQKNDRPLFVMYNY